MYKKKYTSLLLAVAAAGLLLLLLLTIAAAPLVLPSFPDADIMTAARKLSAILYLPTFYILILIMKKKY